MTAILYGATGGSGTSNLYIVDPNNGSTTVVGPIGFAVTGMAAHPGTGVMYGWTSHGSSGGRFDSLISINLSTGAGTIIGPTNTRQLGDISFRADGALFGCNINTTGGLYSINLATGAATRVGTGNDFDGGAANAFYDATHLYRFGQDSDDIFTVDSTTGVFTDTGIFTQAPFSGSWSAADYQPDGVNLWVVLNGFGSPCALGVMDVTSGTFFDVGTLPNNFDAIAWTGTGGPPPFPKGAKLTFGDDYFVIQGVVRGAGAVGGGGAGSISSGGGTSTGGGTGGTTGGTGGGPGGGPSGGGGGTPTGAGVGTIRWGGSYVLGTPGYTDMDVFNIDLNRLTAPAELPGQVVFYRSACSVHTAYDSSIPVGSASLLRDSGGNLIVNSQFSQPGDQCYILDVSDPAMSTALGNACVNWCSTYNFNGIWMDDVVFWATSLVNAMPAGWSQAQWASRLAAHVRRVAKIIRDAGYQIACNSNGFIPGDSPASDDGDNELAWWTTLITPAAANELSPTGLTPEYWMQSPGNITQVRTKGAAFYQFWDGWRRLHPFCHTNGIDFIPVSYATADDDACIYIRATQLLDFNGTGVLYSGTETAVPYGPIWCKDPGAPTSAATQISSGVWQRTFANTTVTVDTNSGFATIT